MTNDRSFRRKKPGSFRKLREHLPGLSSLEVKVLEKSGPEESRAVLDEVWGAALKLRATGKPAAAGNSATWGRG
jgi:hypothetical protein